MLEWAQAQLKRIESGGRVDAMDNIVWWSFRVVLSHCLSIGA